MTTISFEEMFYDRYKITNKIRLIELFGGIGSQAKALENLGVNFEHYRLVEFDKYAIKSYNAVHGTNFETQDIRNVHAQDLGIVDRDKYTYLLTYSFPCQDISLAGLQKGFSKGTGTRSGLLWEVERILNECGDELPQVLLMENVPQVISEKNIKDFNDWRNFLRTKGYTNFTQLLNSKNYGIPQNRERCFMVSILGKEVYYDFPEPKPLKLKLKDMLEDNVDEKYYLSAKMMDYISSKDDSYKVSQNLLKLNREIACTKTTREGYTRADTSDYICEELPDNVDLKVVGMIDNGWNYNAVRRVYSPDGISPTIDTMSGGGRQPKIVEKPSFEEVYNNIKKSSYSQNQNKIQESDICSTLCARDYKDPKCVIENKAVRETIEQNDITQVEDVAYIDGYNRALKANGITPTITTRVSASNNDFILIKNATKQGYLEAQEDDGVDISSRMETHRGTVQKGMIHTIKATCDVGVVVPNMKTQLCNELIEKGIVKDGDVIRHSYTTARMNGEMNDIKEKNISPTLDTRCDCLGVTVNNTGLRIRKLTPKECWRLMGFSDEDFDKAEQVNSNAQLYKQAGNSIVVNVLMGIFKEML